jgi:exopolysaccharide biosynthesis polyprenyl glycosylphosphotransferase
MTDLKKFDPIINPVQTKDIRATNLSLRWRTPILILQSIGLMLLDASMILTSWMVADRIGTPTFGVRVSDTMAPILAVTIGTLAAAGFYGTDDRLHRFAKLFKSLTLAQVVVLIAAFFYQPGLWWVSRSVFSIAWILNFLFIGSARYLLDLARIEIRQRHPIFQQPIVLLGNKVDIDKVRKLVERSRQFRIDSVIDLAVWDMQSQLDQILDLIRSRKVSEVFICSRQLIDNQIIFFWNLKAAGIHLRIVPTDLELPQRSAETKMIEEIPTIRFKSLPIFGINFLLKRFIDIFSAFFLLILISPIFVLIAISIKKTSPGPVFYRQYRVGLKGRRFQVWKFRTMRENADELLQELEEQNQVRGGTLFKISDDPRITKIGKFLRDYSLDELPQLINILHGEMSLVGPRPLSIRDYEKSLENIEQFARDKLLRYEVLPGITGLWQVKGRASRDSDELFYWDMIYILEWSLTLDLRIMIQTIKVVLFKEGSC